MDFHFELTIQYRMNESIFSWPNQTIYNSLVETSPSKTISSWSPAAYTVFQLNTIDDEEIEFLCSFLKLFTNKIDKKKSSIGIICGHSATVDQLRQMIRSATIFFIYSHFYILDIYFLLLTFQG